MGIRLPAVPSQVPGEPNIRIPALIRFIRILVNRSLKPDGKHLGMIPAPRDTTTVCFAGPDKKTLYIITGGALAVNGTEFRTAPDINNNAKTMYKIQMIAEGF